MAAPTAIEVKNLKIRIDQLEKSLIPAKQAECNSLIDQINDKNNKIAADVKLLNDPKYALKFLALPFVGIKKWNDERLRLQVEIDVLRHENITLANKQAQCNIDLSNLNNELSSSKTLLATPEFQDVLINQVNPTIQTTTASGDIVDANGLVIATASENWFKRNSTILIIAGSLIFVSVIIYLVKTKS